MKDILEFIFAALPFIVIGLVLASICANAAKKKKTQDGEENYGVLGMCIGMCMGIAFGTVFHKDTGLGLSIGMALGLAVGTGIKKKK